MSFTKTRAAIQKFQGASTPDYQMQYLAKEFLNSLKDLNGRYLEHLTLDILQQQRKWELENWLTNGYYSISNEFAKECLELCLTVQHLYGAKIKPWTDAALKCYDNIFLKYIQEDRKESVALQTKDLKERDVYTHLEGLGGNFKIIGACFHNIYRKRNSFYHIQKLENSNGKRMLRKPSSYDFNRQRDFIINELQRALRLFREEIEMNK